MAGRECILKMIFVYFLPCSILYSVKVKGGVRLSLIIYTAREGLNDGNTFSGFQRKANQENVA